MVFLSENFLTERAKSELVSEYNRLLLDYLEVIIIRYLRHDSYGWIDTKFDLVSGNDFAEDHPVRGLSTVYSWIQGRALESLTSHVIWFKKTRFGKSRKKLISDVESVASDLLERIYKVFINNNYHSFFTMHPDGSCFRYDGKLTHDFTFTSMSPYNFSDQFIVKGILAAATYFNKSRMIEDARQLSYKIYKSLFNGEFVSDQFAFDANNKGGSSVSNRNSHAPFMIQIGIAILLLELFDDESSLDMGLNLIQYILDKHVNTKNGDLPKFSFWEYIDSDGKPWINGGKIISDPGHALEFVGLALKFTALAKSNKFLGNVQSEKIANIETILPQVLIRNFENGFRENAGGICKTYDLLSCRAVNDDMPWWSLPETMRAALQSCKIVRPDSAAHGQMWDIFVRCHNSLMKYYILPGFCNWPVQNRNYRGEISHNIPAVPDADPSYHTGLCLIDCMKLLDA
jgi:mannose/cellobiose epimerase-like protein (N-acyl-D-glucosamine 2-epimerase family)